MFEPWFWFQDQRDDKSLGQSKVASGDVRNKSHVGILQVLLVTPNEREDPWFCFGICLYQDLFSYGISSRQCVSTTPQPLIFAMAFFPKCKLEANHSWKPDRDVRNTNLEAGGILSCCSVTTWYADDSNSRSCHTTNKKKRKCIGRKLKEMKEKEDQFKRLTE